MRGEIQRHLMTIACNGMAWAGKVASYARKENIGITMRRVTLMRNRLFLRWRLRATLRRSYLYICRPPAIYLAIKGKRGVK